jgi:hypothetical protein
LEIISPEQNKLLRPRQNFLQSLHFFKNCISVFSILLAVLYKGIFESFTGDILSYLESARISQIKTLVGLAFGVSMTA